MPFKNPFGPTTLNHWNFWTNHAILKSFLTKDVLKKNNSVNVSSYKPFNRLCVAVFQFVWES